MTQTAIIAIKLFIFAYCLALQDTLVCMPSQMLLCNPLVFERDREKAREQERNPDKVQTPGCSKNLLSDLLKGREHRKPQTL